MKTRPSSRVFFRQGLSSLGVIELMGVTAGTVVPSTVSYQR